MLQGLVGLVLAVSMAGMGARAMSDPYAVWARRAEARGRSTKDGPSENELQRIKDVGTVGVVLGVVGALALAFMMIRLLSLQSEMRDLEERRERLGALAGDAPQDAAAPVVLSLPE